MAWVLFFDGACGFCRAWVRWLCRVDRRARIAFAPLQGPLAARHGLGGHAVAGGGTLVLLREADGQMFLRSEAVIELARALGWPWRLAALAVWVPRRWRDALYDRIARHRQRIPLGADRCDLDDPRVRARLRD